MYIDKKNRNESIIEMQEFIRQNGFGILISTVDGKPWATHIPMHLSTDGKTLNSHISRGNAQWKNWDSSSEVLAVFQGPNAYISSSWYDHVNVPTWNYIAVHVYGTIRIVEGEALIESLKDLVNKYEKHSVKPVTVEGMPERFLKNEILGIVGFEITISKIEAAYKLSQNRDDKNYKNIVTELKKRKDSDSHEVAKEMQNRRKFE